MLEVNKSRGICISCCCKDKPAMEIKISRNGGVYKCSNIICFNLCKDCLSKLAKEFSAYVKESEE